MKRLIEAPNGDVWYVTNDEVGVLEVTNSGVYKTLKKRAFPQLKDKLVDSFEEIYPYDEENVFIASEDGFIHYNPQQMTVDTHFNVLIRLVQLMKNDSIIYAGNGAIPQAKQAISYKNNALRFRFATTYFANIDQNEFQYYLEGFDEKWSAWTTKSEVEYTNLKAGTYKFRVKGRNINNKISEVTTYSF